MSKTSIEWTERNWNPFYGCRRVSPGCENCYAEQMASRFIGIDKKGRTLPYTGIAVKVKGQGRWTGEIKLNERILTEPLRIKKPTKFFVNSMSDTFYEKMPDEWLDKLFAVMALCPQHTFQVLTKRPERMRDYCDFRHPGNKRIINIRQATAPYLAFCADKTSAITFPLPNIWLGVSVENQKAADERIPLLLQTPAAIRWLSVEPLLEAVDLNTFTGLYTDDIEANSRTFETYLDNLDWVVVGGESGPGARACDIQWIRSVVEQCKAAEVPAFVKQLGAHPQMWTNYGHVLNEVRLNDKKGDITEFPLDLQIREYPK